MNKRVARNIVEGHLQYRSRSIVTHIKKEKKRKDSKRENIISKYSSLKKCIPFQNGTNLFFISSSRLYYIIYPEDLYSLKE